MNIKYIVLFIFFISDSILNGQAVNDSIDPEQKLAIYKKLHSLKQNDNSVKKALIYSQIGSIMSIENRPDSAAHYYLESSRIYKAHNKEYEYNVIQEKLGILYLELFNYKFAINALQTATKYYQDNNYDRSAIKTLNLLGNAYSSNGQEVEARRSFIKALEINKESLHDTLLDVENKTYIVQNDMKTGNFRRAIKFTMSNIKISAEKDYKDHLLTNHIYAGQINYILKDYPNAVKHLEQAESLAKLRNDVVRLPDIYKTLSMAYLEQGNKVKVTETFTKYDKAINDVNNTAIVKSSQEIAERYDSKNKDVLIKQLENENAIKTLNARQQRTAIYGLILGIFFIGLIGYVIYRTYQNQLRTKQIILDQRNELQEEKLKQVEKDSHITAMESMLLGQEAERNRIGKDLHDSLGAMLSTIKLQMSAAINRENLNTNGANAIFQKTKSMIDEACEEVRKISRDMMPITLAKYGLNTALEELVDKYSIEGSPTVIYQSFGINKMTNHDIDLFVYRIIQELVNNSIKHAEATEIIIQINYLADQMLITVEDDGKGFHQGQGKSMGMGLKNIDFRVRYLKGNISIESQPNHGTMTVIEIPLEENIKNQQPKFQF